MKKINVLTKSVYNRIAAGEVIDRPYSAVKELIENSLDAKADDIEIYIEKGGKQLIKVADNGSGIERDDLKAAFMPHATSKISCVDDLDKISTLGFRGEALASISVIAKVEIISVTAGNSANKITCEDGVTGEIMPAALEKGTQVTVRDLFYNTPVRAKFMKEDKKEEADITNFVARYILGNPEVSFKYFVDGKLTLQSFGGGLDEAVAQVYGAKVLPLCFKIDAEKHGVRIHGFIGNQNFFKPNKTYQSLFLNGRYIVNNTIATAIFNAYASYMMKRQFPFYVLNVDVPAEIVDVNVHPNKADVRFVDNKFIFGVVYSVISSVLDGTATAADFVITRTRLPEIQSTMPQEPIKPVENSVQRDEKPVKAEEKAVEIPEKQPESVKREYFDPINDLTLAELFNNQEKNTMSVTDDTMPPSLDGNVAAFELQNAYYERKKSEQQRIEFSSCKYRGNLFNTYLMYEICDEVYIIDQHAAHERLIYDSLRKNVAERKIARQPLLIPYIFQANAGEARFLEETAGVLRSMGFGIAPFGYGSFRVDTVPVDLQDINIKDFFDEILSCVGSLKDIKLEEILKDKLAMTACKHAVKGGMELTDDEISSLFKMLDGNMGLKCPHGRPICVKLTKKDIEKMFKRIV